MSIALPPTVTAEFEARFQQPPAAKIDEKELTRWQEMCRDVIEERDRLRAELEATKAERDDYRKALLKRFAQEDFSFTREEVTASRGQRPTLDEFLDELERQDP